MARFISYCNAEIKIASQRRRVRALRALSCIKILNDTRPRARRRVCETLLPPSRLAPLSSTRILIAITENEENPSVCVWTRRINFREKNAVVRARARRNVLAPVEIWVPPSTTSPVNFGEIEGTMEDVGIKHYTEQAIVLF